MQSTTTLLAKTSFGLDACVDAIVFDAATVEREQSPDRTAHLSSCWARFPQRMARDARIGADALVQSCLAMIFSHRRRKLSAGYTMSAGHSLRTIGMGKRAFNRAIRELKASGYLDRSQRGGKRCKATGRVYAVDTWRTDLDPHFARVPFPLLRLRFDGVAKPNRHIAVLIYMHSWPPGMRFYTHSIGQRFGRGERLGRDLVRPLERVGLVEKCRHKGKMARRLSAAFYDLLAEHGVQARPGEPAATTTPAQQTKVTENDPSALPRRQETHLAPDQDAVKRTELSQDDEKRTEHTTPSEQGDGKRVDGKRTTQERLTYSNRTPPVLRSVDSNARDVKSPGGVVLHELDWWGAIADRYPIPAKHLIAATWETVEYRAKELGDVERLVELICEAHEQTDAGRLDALAKELRSGKHQRSVIDKPKQLRHAETAVGIRASQFSKGDRLPPELESIKRQMRGVQPIVRTDQPHYWFLDRHPDFTRNRQWQVARQDQIDCNLGELANLELIKLFIDAPENEKVAAWQAASLRGGAK